MSIGPLAFLSPWLLTALVALPLIWWLLRAVPPRPRRIAFPPTRILVGLESKEQTPVKTPWWLTLIRLLAAGLIILALANPVLNPDRGQTLKGGGPLVLVVDNGVAVRAKAYSGERLDWDLRADPETWASWLEQPPGMVSLGMAYASSRLQFVTGDYVTMSKEPSMAGPFMKSFSVMARV